MSLLAAATTGPSYESIPQDGRANSKASTQFLITPHTLSARLRTLPAAISRFDSLAIELDFEDTTTGKTQTLSKTNCEALLEEMQKARNITAFSANKLRIENEPAKIMARVLMSNGIRRITFSQCNLPRDVGEIFAKHLTATGSHLENLALREIRMPPASLLAIGEALAKNKMLKTLDLRDNIADAKAARGFVESLERNQTIREVQLTCEEAAKAVFNSIGESYQVVPSKLSNGYLEVRILRQSLSLTPPAVAVTTPSSKSTKRPDVAASLSVKRRPVLTPSTVGAHKREAELTVPPLVVLTTPPEPVNEVEQNLHAVYFRETQMTTIQANEPLFLYYHSFRILFQGMLVASGAIEAGMVGDARKNQLEKIASYVAALSSSIPLVGGAAQTVVGVGEKVISFFSDIGRGKEVHKLAGLFKGRDVQERADRLAIELTLAQEETLHKIRAENSLPTPNVTIRRGRVAAVFHRIINFAVKAKEKLSHLIDAVKSRDYDNSCDDPIVQKAGIDFATIMGEIGEVDANESSKWTIPDFVSFICADVDIKDPMSPRTGIERAFKQLGQQGELLAHLTKQMEAIQAQLQATATKNQEIMLRKIEVTQKQEKAIEEQEKMIKELEEEVKKATRPITPLPPPPSADSPQISSSSSTSRATATPPPTSTSNLATTTDKSPMPKSGKKHASTTSKKSG